VVDLGLRLSDVNEMGLQSEPVSYPSKVDPRVNLRENGATEEECEFLVDERKSWSGGWTGKRVELNAMTSPQFIAWLEKKLIAAGVKKLVPGEEALTAAYKRAVRLSELEKLMLEAKAKTDCMEVAVPRGLASKIRRAIKGTDRPWDLAVWDLVRRSVDRTK
jgi:hypothetical protein